MKCSPEWENRNLKSMNVNQAVQGEMRRIERLIDFDGEPSPLNFIPVALQGNSMLCRDVREGGRIMKVIILEHQKKIPLIPVDRLFLHSTRSRA